MEDDERLLSRARQLISKFFRVELASPSSRFDYADDLRATCDDLASETLAAVWRQLTVYKPREGKSFDDWVMGFAWRQLHRYWERGLGGLSRERKRHRPAEVYLENSGDGPDEALEVEAYKRDPQYAIGRRALRAPAAEQPENDGWERELTDDETTP